MESLFLETGRCAASTCHQSEEMLKWKCTCVPDPLPNLNSEQQLTLAISHSTQTAQLRKANSMCKVNDYQWLNGLTCPTDTVLGVMGTFLAQLLLAQ